MNDSMTFEFHPSLQDEDYENDIGDDHHDHDHDHHLHPHSLSRLSVCTSSTVYGADDDDFDDAFARNMSGLSIESLEGEGDDADGEFSSDGSDSDSEKELSVCYPLNQIVKDSANDNEGQSGKKKMKNNTRRRRIRKETWVWNSLEKNRSKIDENEKENEVKSEGSDQNGSIWVITRPKGGRRSLCMDLEEVKACRDLGFELEVPSHLSVSLSNSTLDTSSGGTSPITNWRISSPGDDPKDVKARLKMWAHVVAASASKYCT